MLRKLNSFLNIVIGSFLGVFIGFGIYKFWHFKNLSQFICHAVCTVVHRVTVGWCHGGSFGGRMYYPKANYLEKIKAITSRLLGSRRERKSGICRIKERCL